MFTRVVNPGLRQFIRPHPLKSTLAAPPHYWATRLYSQAPLAGTPTEKVEPPASPGNSVPPAVQPTPANAPATAKPEETAQPKDESPYSQPASANNDSTPTRAKVTLSRIKKLHKIGTPITVLTAHDYPSGVFADQSGMDICLVGDSLAMVALGYDSTTKITLDEMMHHTRAVARGCKKPFIVGDLPFGTYEKSPEYALESSIRYIQQGNIEAVKLEGGREMVPTIKRIVSVGIPVMGHIGLTPQRAVALGGFKVQGTTLEKVHFYCSSNICSLLLVAYREVILEDALALEDAGCFAIVLEAIPSPVAKFITDNLKVPTIGIGAGSGCSGQVLVQLDALGVYDKFTPKFCKLYESLGRTIVSALSTYNEEVRSRAFPVEGLHTYPMAKGEEEKFKIFARDYVCHNR